MNFFNFYKHLTRALQFIMCIIIVKKWGSVGYTYVSLLNFSFLSLWKMQWDYAISNKYSEVVLNINS